MILCNTPQGSHLFVDRASSSGCRQTIEGVLQEIIIAPAKSGFVRNSFDCVAPRAVSIRPLGQGIVAMLEVLTAFFGVMSAGIFIAHACDGYLSRP
jgi:hypothetical protein